MLKWGLMNGKEDVERGSSGPHIIHVPHFLVSASPGGLMLAIYI